MRSETEQRQAVITEARTWCKTPFKWECCLKGYGVDCGHFLAQVFINAGVKKIDLSKFKQPAPNWFLHKGSRVFYDMICQFAVPYELTEGRTPEPGDLVLLKVAHDLAHSAIVVDWPRIVGAAAGFVVTEWQNFYTSPQFGNRQFICFDPWAPGAGGNVE